MNISDLRSGTDLDAMHETDELTEVEWKLWQAEYSERRKNIFSRIIEEQGNNSVTIS